MFAHTKDFCEDRWCVQYLQGDHHKLFAIHNIYYLEFPLQNIPHITFFNFAY